MEEKEGSYVRTGRDDPSCFFPKRREKKKIVQEGLDENVYVKAKP